MPDYDVVETTNKRPNPPPAAEGQAEGLALDLRSNPLMRLAPPADALKAGCGASVLDRARAFQPARAVNSLLHLQRRYGNRYVQRALALAGQQEGEAEPTREVQSAIEGARGGGQALDGSTPVQGKPASGVDLSGARVHTDSSASASVQCQCSCDGYTASDGECEECRAKRLHLRRRATNQAQPAAVPAGAYTVLRPPRQPMDRDTGAFVESCFGHDLSQARVPTTGTAPSNRLEGPGAETADPGETAPVEPLSGSLPGAPGACVVNASLPSSRSGVIRSAEGTVGEKFEVRVEWSSAPASSRGETSYCAAECGEYHQFIKGHMRSSPNQDGSDLTDVSGKIFGGAALDENVFREDGLDDNPNARYGHRKEPQTMDEKYDPDRAAGTKYVGRDFPRVMIGTFADIDVTFLGKVVDTCNVTENQSATWRVQYRGLIRP